MPTDNVADHPQRPYYTLGAWIDAMSTRIGKRARRVPERYGHGRHALQAWDGIAKVADHRPDSDLQHGRHWYAPGRSCTAWAYPPYVHFQDDGVRPNTCGCNHRGACWNCR
jgi:hypothetical protein